jgi:hypothetical protein
MTLEEAFMSYQEKVIFGQFLPPLLGCAYFFGILRVGVRPWSLLGNLILVIGLQIVYLIVVAIFSKIEGPDERDRLIEYKAYKVGYLSLMVLGGIWVWALVAQWFTVGQLTSPTLIIMAWFGVEALRTGTQLVLHRMSVAA